MKRLRVVLRAPAHISNRSGFTLVELLVVIAILGGLAAIVFVSINPKLRLDSARNAQEKTNAKQLTQAIQLHLADKALNPAPGPDPCPITVPDQTTVNICKPGNTGPGCIDLSCVSNRGYIPDIPVTREAAGASTPNSGYALHREGPFFTVEPVALNLPSSSSSSTSSTSAGGGSSSSSSSTGYPPINLNTLTAQQILQLLIDRGFVTIPNTPNPTVANLLARLDFERFFSTLTVDETMTLLIQRNYINGATTAANLKSQLDAKLDMSADILKPDGVLSALWLTENSSGIPFLKQAPTVVRNALISDFTNGNQLAVIENIGAPRITPTRLIGLFYDNITNTSTTLKRPVIYAWFPSLWNGFLNQNLYLSNLTDNFYAMYTPWIGGGNAGSTPLVYFYSRNNSQSTYNLQTIANSVNANLPAGHRGWRNANLHEMCWETIDPIPGQPGKYTRTYRYQPETPTPDYTRCSNVQSYTPGNPPTLVFLGVHAPLSPPYNSRIDDTGNPREFKTVWWDEWVASMNLRMNHTFGEYKAVGGNLDYFDFDLEVSDMGSYNFFSILRNSSQFGANKFFPEKTPTGKLPCDLVYEDPRWNTIADTAEPGDNRTLRQKLLDAGALPSDVDYTSVNGQGIHTGGLCNMTGDGNDNISRARFGRVWNAVMERRTDRYAERALLEPLLAMYPNLTTQGYRVHFRNQAVNVTSNDAFHMPSSFYGMGSKFGTHQSTVHYQGLDNIPVDTDGSGTPTFVQAVPKALTWVSGMRIDNGVATINIGGNIPSETLATDQYGLKIGDIFGVTAYPWAAAGDTTIINSTNTGQNDVKSYLGFFQVTSRPNNKTVLATPYANTQPEASGTLPFIDTYDYRSASENLYINTWHPFNALIDDVLNLRTAYATTTIPNRPFFTQPAWATLNNDLNTGLTETVGTTVTAAKLPFPTSGNAVTDMNRSIHPYPIYNPETLFHAGLMGVEEFMSWNPYTTNLYGREFPPYWTNANGTQADRVYYNNKLMSDAVKEVQSVVGFATKKPVVYPPLSYTDKYVISGMEAAGKRVFRLTPDPRQIVVIDPTTIQSSSLTATSTTPVKITIGSQVLQIANAYIYNPTTPTTKCPYAAPLQNCGFWIIQTQPPLYLTEPPAGIITKLTNGGPQ